MFLGKGGFPAATTVVFAALCACALQTLPAQYPGQLSNSGKDESVLRSIAVLEWTGTPAHPNSSRLIPVSLFDNGELQDGSLYLARPIPMALYNNVEYEIQQNGEPVRLFDLHSASQEMSIWVGHGTVRPIPAKDSASGRVLRPIEDENNERPVLHRKKQEEANQPARANKKKKENDEGSVSAYDRADPERPHLKRGIPTEAALLVTPTLVGLPDDLQQAVAVSDARDRPVHSWSYTWPEPGDRERLKLALEKIARDALGVNSPPAPENANPATPDATEESALPPLDDEDYRVFALDRGAGATLVYSASTVDSAEKKKWITLIAQPDLYGNLSVLLKQTTDHTHLDERPMLRLIDAVDALADNHGELLFELRGASQRQFVLYRIQQGRAEKLFVSSEAVIAATSRK